MTVPPLPPKPCPRHATEPSIARLIAAGLLTAAVVAGFLAILVRAFWP